MTSLKTFLLSINLVCFTLRDVAATTKNGHMAYLERMTIKGTSCLEVVQSSSKTYSAGTDHKESEHATKTREAYNQPRCTLYHSLLWLGKKAQRSVQYIAQY